MNKVKERCEWTWFPSRVPAQTCVHDAVWIVSTTTSDKQRLSCQQHLSATSIASLDDDRAVLHVQLIGARPKQYQDGVLR